MTENHFFAATLSNIGETSADGSHVRIWGVGTTEEAARQDAVRNVGDNAEDDFEIVGVSEAVYTHVKLNGHDHRCECSIGGHRGFIDAIYKTVLDGEDIRLA